MSERNRSPRRQRGLILAALTAFVAYNTFLPFRFYTSWSKIRRQIGEVELIPFMRNGHWVSHTDILGNILLFIPIGAAAWFYFYSRKEERAPALWHGMGYSFLFSLFIEITQIFLRYRVPSIHDVFTNTLGGLAGAWLASRLFFRYGRSGARYFSRHLRAYPGSLAVLIFVAYILLYQLLPFVPGIDRPEHLLSPLHPREWLADGERLKDVLILLPLALATGLLSTLPARGSRLAKLMNVTVLLTLLFFSETVHLVMAGRALDIYRLAVLLGGVVAGRHIVKQRTAALRMSLALLVIAGYMFPFHFDFAFHLAADRLLKMLTPFYFYYKTTSIWNIWDMAFSLLLGGVVAWLVHGRPASAGQRPYMALLVIVLLEGTQIFIKQRIADITDILMAGFGVFIFMLLRQAHYRAVQEKKPTSKNSSDDSVPATRA